MIKFEIEYNPYLAMCVFRKNGKILSENSKLMSKKNERLQSFLEPLVNWKGLVEEIADNYHAKEIEIVFYGRKMDYDDLKCCIDGYQGDTIFILKLVECKYNKDAAQEFKAILDEIKEKNLLQFLPENEKGKNILDVYEDFKKEIFEIRVVAAENNERAALINAILHTEWLPVDNKVCSVAKEYDSYPRVTSADMEGYIPTITDSKVRICLRDDLDSDTSQSIVVYVMNAMQIGDKENTRFLINISNEMEKTEKYFRNRFIFVVDKCDELKKEKGESIHTLIINIKNYLRQFGIVNPLLILTSSRWALLLRKNQRREKLTEGEQKELVKISDFIKKEELYLEEYAELDSTIKSELEEEKKIYNEKKKWNELALIHTGIPVVEKVMREYLIKYVYPLRLEQAARNMVSILDKLNTQKITDNYLAKNKENLKKVKRQIEQAKAGVFRSREAVRLCEERLNEIDAKPEAKVFCSEEQIKGVEIQCEQEGKEIEEMMLECLKNEVKERVTLTEKAVEQEKISETIEKSENRAKEYEEICYDMEQRIKAVLYFDDKEF